MSDSGEIDESAIAIVGMSGRFPGAPDVDQFWERVSNGDDCLVDLDPALLIEAGLPPAVVNDPNYVPRAGMLDGVGRFDAEFFGIGSRDASIMDPQHRHFLECSWAALESGGHVPETFDGAIGVFAGCGMNTYLINNLITNQKLVDQIGWFLLRHTSNDKDFLPTFASYKLDLRGPSVSVQTACSTSLVAMHLAAQSLLSFECDLALAGGSTIEVPHGVGYTFQEGEILSPDGHCRAFEANSAGTVLTSGTGVVSLRRLADAIEDGDPVLAILRSSAMNNDGARKVSYLAPSVDGHADVVKEALAVAGLSARDIQLVDAHGTGTPVGDPIEFAALTEAFRSSTDDVGFCRLTSTKPNIGHLDTAAGVASVIKVVQALRHRTLPPLANFEQPSPLLDVERSPFELSGEAVEWPGDAVRRAGVSSLGVGGTNAHVILEEAPTPQASEPSAPEQVLCLSGVSIAAVDASVQRLAARLEQDPKIELADVAHTLAVGRRHMKHRRVMTITDTVAAPQQLRDADRSRSTTGSSTEHTPRLAFMFPGGGSQYPGMGSGLDERFDVFHDSLSDSIRRVEAADGPSLTALMAPDGDPEVLRQADVSLPAVFITSVALARQWMAWGAQPDALVGHSLGEYVSAHLAGVLSLDDAIALVVTRSRLMANASAGRPVGMLAVSLAEAELADRLSDEISMAVVNTADDCVVAGPLDAVERLAAQLDADDIQASLLKLSAAAHSSILDPVLDEFGQFVRTVTLNAPTMQYPSNLTGTWITTDQATDPQYWVDHLRGTVRFADCLSTVLEGEPMVMSELGPGQALSAYARMQTTPPVASLPALRHPKDASPDTVHTLQSFAGLWANGVNVNIDQFAGERTRQLVLPTYPFQGERHWIEPGEGSTGAPGVSGATSTVAIPPIERLNDMRDWFWEPTWSDAPLENAQLKPATTWTLVGEAGDTLVTAIADELRRQDRHVDVLGFDADLTGITTQSVCIIGASAPESADVTTAADLWLGTGLDAVRNVGALPDPGSTFAAVTRLASSALERAERPVDALARGPVLVAAKEYPGLRTLHLDVDHDTTAIEIVVELLTDCADNIVARRGERRMAVEMSRRPVDPVAHEASAFVNGGNYFVTGGLGDVGHAMATHLASTHGAQLAILSSSPIPSTTDERVQWARTHGSDDPTSRRIRRIEQLETLGNRVVVVEGDAADAGSLTAAIDRAEELLGSLDGAIHAAGRLRDGLIELSERSDHDVALGAKAGGAAVLVEELSRRDASLLLLISSTSSFLAAEGQVAYVASNAFLDELAGSDGSGLRVVTFNSGAWAGIGMAAEMVRRLRLGLGESTPVTHPVLSERLESSGTTRFAGRLTTADDWVVDEHRIANGTALLPGTGHIELMLAAAGLVEPNDDLLVSDVLLIEPLIVDDGDEVIVQVIVDEPDANGTRTVRIESDHGKGLTWHLHSEGQLVVANAELPEPWAEAEPGDTRVVDPLAAQRRTLRLGHRWESVDTANVSDERADAHVVLPDDVADEVTAWSAHPALVDAAIGVAITLRSDDSNSLMAPVTIESVRRFGAVPDSVRVAAVRRSTSENSLVADVRLLDEQGRMVLDITGLELRALGDGSTLGAGRNAIERPRALPSAGVFVELAEGSGLRQSDAGEILERVVGSGVDRLVVSSVELDDLVPPPPPELVVDDNAEVATAAGLEGALQSMWSELLGVAVEPDSNFFDLGGHSLIAIRLIARVHRELGVKLQLAVLFDAPTVDELAALLRTHRPDIDADFEGIVDSEAIDPAGSTPAERPTVTPAKKTLISLNRDGDGAPLSIVHGAGGNVLFLSQISRLMKGQRPLNGIQAIGIDSEDPPDATVQEMAARYVAALTDAGPGPYLIGGYSGGGIVALEMGHQLRTAGEEVPCVVLFDSIPAGLAYPPSKTSRRNVTKNLLRYGPRPIATYVKDRLGKTVLRVLVEEAPAEAEETPFWLEEREQEGFVDLFDHFAQISLSYDMPKYDFDVILMKADLVWPYQPWDYHWKQHIAGELTVLEVPGDHHTMFIKPYVTALWDRLAPLLTECDTTAGSSS